LKLLSTAQYNYLKRLSVMTFKLFYVPLCMSAHYSTCWDAQQQLCCHPAAQRPNHY